MTSLHRAVSSKERDGIAILISKNLNLNVAGTECVGGRRGRREGEEKEGGGEEEVEKKRRRKSKKQACSSHRGKAF